MAGMGRRPRRWDILGTRWGSPAISWRRAVFACLATAGLLSACGSGTEPGQLLNISQTRIPFGELPSVVVPHGGFMWVLDTRANLIGKIDPATNLVIDTWDLDRIVGSARNAPSDLVATSSALWIAVPTKSRLYELDPSTGNVLSTIRTRGFVTGIQVVRGSLWFVDGGIERFHLVRLDPASGKTLARLRIGPINTDVGDLLAFEGSVWLVRGRARYVTGPQRRPTFFVSNQLWQIDPRTNDVVSRRALGSTYTRGAVNPVIGDTEVSGDGVWMSRIHERRLLLMTPQSGRVREEISVVDFELPWQFALVRGDLWVGELNQQRVMWIDPETKEREVAEVGATTSFIGSGFGSAWAPVHGSPTGGEVVRLTHN